MDTPSQSFGTSDVVDVNMETSARLVLFSHEFPSDEVQELFRKLQRHSKLPKFRLLALFLEECASVLKDGVQKLPRQHRVLVPPFQDIAALASYFNELSKGPLGGAFEGAFLCIYEIAMLIGHHLASDITYDLFPPATCLVGISVGLFAAAAAAVSTSLVELVNYGSESVRIAFAFCLHVGRVSQLLETRGPEESPKSWAWVVTGLPADVVQAELDHFNGDEAATLTQVSISHIDESSIGVTGPPARLAQLFRQSQVLGSSRHSLLPVTGGLCHVPNLYTTDDVMAILESADIWERWPSCPVRLPLLSPFTGGAFSAKNAVDLLQAICTEALTEPLFFDKLPDGVVKHLSNVEVSHCQVLHYRKSLLSDKIMSAVAGKLSCASLYRQDLVDWALQDESMFNGNRPRSPCNSKLAVVGMACRMPGDADTPERFWQLLVDGRDTHTTVPPDRFDLETHYDPTGKIENSTNTRLGNFIDNPGHFDASFFNMSPREAEQTDPMQRLALVTAYEALEMAGFVPNRTPSSHVSRVGTYYGQASDDYREVNASQKVGTYGIPGTERAFGNGRINYFFNFSGPSFNIDTACSSGLAAVHAACSALWAGNADTVVAGGLNVITSPDIYCMLTKGHFLSKTGQCKVWDAGADGYCRGDGVGSVVIKRLEDAEADNDVVLATIVAGATNHSAESISITHPHVGAQMDNYRQVMSKAGVSPLDVSYVELHGTGTQAGDAVESESVLSVFAPLGRRQHPEQRLHLGAVKSNIGHGEAAAGIASLIKVLLMYRHGIIPRHVGISTTINPVVANHLAHRNASILSENTPWHHDKKRYAIVNSFGAHGGNTTLLLEDAPSHGCEDCRPDSPTSQVICVSAKSRTSLLGNVRALLCYLDSNPGTDFRDVAYTTCARRIHHHTRIAAPVSSTAQARSFLQAAADDIDCYSSHVSKATSRPTVFAFSGQGCFYRGAATRLFEHSPSFCDQILQLDHLISQSGFPSVLSAIVGDIAHTVNYGARSANDAKCYDTEDSATDGPLIVQLAMLVLQVALAHYWEQLGITPSVVIGHSLGEYAALVVAGVLSFADAAFLVGKRAQLLLAACKPGTHAMLSVRGASSERIAELCEGSKCRYEDACLNGRSDTVISGTVADINAVRDILQNAGLKCLLLDVPFAFHSSQLDPMLDEFENIARRVTFKAPSIPIVSPLLGRCIFDGKAINETYLRRATREPVNFIAALDAASSAGIVDSKTAWIDIGPHPVCTSFVQNHFATSTAHTFASLRRGDETLLTLNTSLAGLHCLGLPVAWNEYFLPYEKSYRLLSIDHYYWDAKNYWIPYVGTWTLDKAHAGTKKNNGSVAPASFFTSSVQHILSEEIGETKSSVTALSNVAHPDFLGAINGHKINGCGVVTGSIWADMALTVGEHLYKRTQSNAEKPYMNVSDMEVLESQVVREEGVNDTSMPQLIRIEGVMDWHKKHTSICWYTASADGSRSTDKPFAMATVRYEDPQVWRAEWQTVSHLVTAQARSLWKMASGAETSLDSSSVSRLSRTSVYQLFSNVVDYGMRYRGMQCVALAEDKQEATADITLDADRHGVWHTPPHWIDGAFQLAGFVMNAFGVRGEVGGSSRDSFYITPGWRNFRLAEPLQPGSPGYRNYVRMFAVEGQPGAYTGDIYLLRGDNVVGVCAGIKFKRVPRALMSLMFSRRDTGKKSIHCDNDATTSGSSNTDTSCLTSASSSLNASGGHSPQPTSGTTTESASDHSATHPAPKTAPPGPGVRNQQQLNGESTLVSSCMTLIATEMGLSVEDLTEDAAFAELGLDSLMSLVLSEKISAELDIEVKASIFLECVTVRQLSDWLKSQ